MERSLSVLLPVHNAQSHLALLVEEFLEILPELTRDFEVVIVDDGSGDATIEVADELARHYPQVVAVRHASPRGRIATLRTALERSRGEILLVRDDDCDLPLDEAHRLWRATDEHEIVLGQFGLPPEPKWSGWPAPDAKGGMQMLARRAIEPLIASLTDQTTLRAALLEYGHSWHEVEVTDCTGERAARRASAFAYRVLPGELGQAVRPARTDPPPSPGVRPKRPKYLTALKDFALGE